MTSVKETALARLSSQDLCQNAELVRKMASHGGNVKVTLKQIAERADVSISLVSKVLNGKEVSVSQEKREKILQLAEELKGASRESGRLARSLRTPNVIALIRPYIRCDFLAGLTEEAINWANQHG